MARIHDPTPGQQDAWTTWVLTLPPAVSAVANLLDIWTLYRLRSTGQRVRISSFSEEEDGSVTLGVTVLAEYNAIVLERMVYGVDHNDLEPCGLPSHDGDATSPPVA